jgi:glutaredoxin 3
MSASVRIYGKDSCPYTTNARAAFAKQGFTVEYVNVRADPGRLPEMLEHSGGRRAVPVIVDADGKVTVGYGGT